MEGRKFSFIIPVFNRPNEIKELLQSFQQLNGQFDFEIVIVEDGSTETSEKIITDFQKKLNISYYQKPNSGPGDSRNYGMKKANGNYFIILDSDCILPKDYLSTVKESLNENYVDFYGGPDAAHPSFSRLQKAINFAMTSTISTGGIRGGRKSLKNFQPRSFNMGISREAFEASKGFGNIHPGEDPDLSIRLIKLGFQSRLIKEAFVYHKRRISWKKFYNQVYKFGLVRPILNHWHPKSSQLTYWFPTLFLIGLIGAISTAFYGFPYLLYLYGIYVLLAFLTAILQTQNLWVSIQAVIAIFVQFFGYGYGFLKASILLNLSKESPEKLFPNLFFHTTND